MRPSGSPTSTRCQDSHPGPDASEPIVLHLRATYYDTRHLDLVNAKVTLRRREGGIDDGWHLKLPAGAGARREIGVPLRFGGRRGPTRIRPPRNPLGSGW